MLARASMLVPLLLIFRPKTLTMKNLKLLICTILFFGIVVSANSQSKTDTLAIKETALNYIEGYFYKDAKRMEAALHPELVKRSVQTTKDGTDFIINLGASYMIMRTANNDNRHAANPEGKMVAEVIIYDITANSSTAKVTNNQYKFIDYLHLAKFNGEWKIVNVLWASIPDDKK